MRPSDAGIRLRLQRQSSLPFSYPTLGATAAIDKAPSGYDIDQSRCLLGSGEATFAAACDALRRWEMFRIGWVELCWPIEPIAVARVVGILARPLGIWSLSACRIVYVVNQSDRFGFAYGTLPDHVERGEERFLIERDAEDRVWYELLAFSRPRHPLARISYPWVRTLQRRFARDSMAAMRRAVGSEPDGSRR